MKPIVFQGLQRDTHPAVPFTPEEIRQLRALLHEPPVEPGPKGDQGEPGPKGDKGDPGKDARTIPIKAWTATIERVQGSNAPKLLVMRPSDQSTRGIEIRPAIDQHTGLMTGAEITPL